MISISIGSFTISASLIGQSFSYFEIFSSNSFLSGMKKLFKNSSLTFLCDSLIIEVEAFFSYFSSSLNFLRYLVLYSSLSFCNYLGLRIP